MALTDSIKNTRLFSANGVASYRSNAPAQYDSRQKRYYNLPTTSFNAEIAQYSSDYFLAEIEGLDAENPTDYVKCYIRMADVIKPSASSTNEFDNFKWIMVAGVAPETVTDKAEAIRRLTIGTDYLRKGTKIKCAGSTWLVINPSNISGVNAKAVIQRCDAVWHYLDYYGNVCAEPFCIGTDLMRANDLDAQRSVMIVKGYFNAKCQYNDATKNLGINSRLILGSSAYRITGYSDFIQEFTEDADSVRMLQFTLRYEQPQLSVDDMENRVAGGKLFKWEIVLSGNNTLKTGETVTLTAQSRRTSEVTPSEIVTDDSDTSANTETENVTGSAHEITYIWASSNDDVLTVDESGTVTAVAEGTANVTCTLKQNPNISTAYEMTVEGVDAEPHVEFNSAVPISIPAYTSLTLGATYYESGAATAETVTWTVTGADKNSYTYAENTDNTVTITCWNGSVDNLVVTAACNGTSTTAEIVLVGII